MEIKANLSFESCSYLRSNSSMEDNFKNLSKLLNVTNDFEGAKNLSVGDIEKGAKIFIFLNSCPASKKASDDLKMLYSFLAAKRSSTRALVSPSVRPSVRGQN